MSVEDFKKLLSERAPKLLAIKDRHFYEKKDGVSYPSISTILSATMQDKKRQGLEYWRNTEPAHEYITKQAQETGTQTHQMIEDYFIGKLRMEDFDLLPIAHFNNLLSLLMNITPIVGIEQKMYSDRLKVSGMSDCIGYYKGELSIIDYKTKRKHQINSYLTDYYIQTTCYAQMFEEVTGQKIKQVVILISSEKNEKQEFIKQCDDYIEPLESRIKQYYDNYYKNK